MVTPDEDPAEAPTVGQTTAPERTSRPVLGDDAVELTTGDEIGRDRLVVRLGAGAMGVVWAANDPQLDRKVVRDRETGVERRLPSVVSPTAISWIDDHTLTFATACSARAERSAPEQAAERGEEPLGGVGLRIVLELLGVAEQRRQLVAVAPHAVLRAAIERHVAELDGLHRRTTRRTWPRLIGARLPRQLDERRRALLEDRDERLLGDPRAIAGVTAERPPRQLERGAAAGAGQRVHAT